MGIKGLWSLLTPYCEKKSLHEIRGETIAIDLSGWVCDSQNVTEYHVQPRLYLRNLFFRTTYLLLADIHPIFVLEGDAPMLKQDVMAARNAIQFKGSAPRNEDAPKHKPDTGRKRFAAVLRECESLLKSMGVQCVKGRGEAEAMCAHLNMFGLVDAVVSQDSDCFAYGARRVYRNFSVVGSKGGGAHQGSVDSYDLTAIQNDKDFGRNKMISLALLCGCDYIPGAVGVSITNTLAFLETVSEADAVNRLLSWVSDPEKYERMRRKIEAPGVCGTCGHSGKQHARQGCGVCNTGRGCTDNGYKQEKQRINRELQLRSRALSFERPFPDPLVMKEFLQTPEKPPNLNQRSPPSMIKFIKIMVDKLGWTERYCVEKFLPLLTKWHLSEDVIEHTIRAKHIKKKRTPRGVPSFEVVWEDIDGHYEGLVPDDQLEGNKALSKEWPTPWDITKGESSEIIWTTIERQDLMRKIYPSVVEFYEASIIKPAKEKKQRKVKESVPKKIKETKPRKKAEQIVGADIGDELFDCLQQMPIKDTNEMINNKSINFSLNKSKRKAKKRRVQKKIDSFIEKKRKLSDSVAMRSLVNSFKQISFEKQNNSNTNQIEDSIFNDLSKDIFSEEELSLIIDEIIDKKQTFIKDLNVKSILNHELFTNKLIDKVNNCSTPKNSPQRSSRKSSCSLNRSYFYDQLTEGGDAFEMSVEMWKGSFKYDSDKTVDYSV